MEREPHLHPPCLLNNCANVAARNVKGYVTINVGILQDHAQQV